MYWEQGGAALSTFLSHFQVSTPTGSLLLATFEQAQLEVGMGLPFLELDFATYSPLLTPCWLRALWEFLAYAGISLRSSDLVPRLPLQRVGDAFLMDLAFADPSWSRKDLLTINRCHLALHCLTVADVATGDGLYLRTLSFPPLPLPSTYLWPKEFPSRSDWKIWEKFLSSTLCSGFRSLRQPLGPWLRTPHLTSSWGYLDVSSSTVYLPSSDASFSVHVQRPFVPPCRSATPYDFSDVSLSLPASARFIAIVSPSATGVLSSGYALGPTPIAAPSSWTDILRDLGDSAWPITHLSPPSPPEWLLDSIQTGSLLAVCDGSYQPHRCRSTAASAWLMADSRNLSSQCRSVCEVVGPLDSINSYRAELQGMHSLLLYLNTACKYFGSQSGHVLVACDNNTVATICRHRGAFPPPEHIPP